MKFPPAIANLAWAAASWPAHGRFLRALQQPAETQLALLQRLVGRHADCRYGREHAFSTVRSYEEFARCAPLVDYENLEPYIECIRRGEGKVLTADPVQRLVPTSGSGGARKLIPFTAGLQRHFDRALGPWISDLFLQQPRLTCGPAYWSITPAVPQPAEEQSAVSIGFDDDSRYLGGVRQRLVESILAAPPALRLVSDIETFRYLTLLCLLRRRDLALISVWHPSFLTLLLETLPRNWDEWLDDIRAGRCKRCNDLPAPIQQALRFGPLPGRAKELRRADPHRPESLWPALQLISCWRDGHAEFAADELQRRFPNTVIQPKGLLATEAFVTIPFAGRHPVAVRSHFLEFIDETGARRLVHQLREGECYDVVVTTSGGLWRYRLRDLVKVTGYVERTPSLRFLGKSNNVSDRFGEKLSETFVAESIREITAALPNPPCFAMLAPGEDELGWRYTLYLEGATACDLAGPLDKALRRNPHYAWCRDLGQLLAPRLVLLAAGEGYKSYVARELKHGRRLGEIKASALSTRTGWSDWFRRAPPGAA